MAEMWYVGMKWGTIEELWVEKETDKFVVTKNGRREGKDYDWRWIRRDRPEAVRMVVLNMEAKLKKTIEEMRRIETALNEFLKKEGI